MNRKHTAILPQAERVIAEMARARAVKAEPKPLLGRLVPRAALAGVACLAFGGTALAATGAWKPIVGTAEDPATLYESPSPGSLTDQMAILRRPVTDADHSPAVEASLTAAVLPEGVRLDSVRYVGPADNGQATIILTGEKSRYFIAEGEPVCFVRPWKGNGDTPGEIGSGTSAECFDAKTLDSGRAFVIFTESGDPNALSAGLVPDGVATVTVHFANAPDVTIPVKDNFWELELDREELRPSATRDGVYATTWKDADGNVVPQQAAG